MALITLWNNWSCLWLHTLTWSLMNSTCQRMKNLLRKATPPWDTSLSKGAKSHPYFLKCYTLVWNLSEKQAKPNQHPTKARTGKNMRLDATLSDRRRWGTDEQLGLRRLIILTGPEAQLFMEFLHLPILPADSQYEVYSIGGTRRQLESPSLTIIAARWVRTTCSRTGKRRGGNGAETEIDVRVGFGKTSNMKKVSRQVKLTPRCDGTELQSRPQSEPESWLVGYSSLPL